MLTSGISSQKTVKSILVTDLKKFMSQIKTPFHKCEDSYFIVV